MISIKKFILAAAAAAGLASAGVASATTYTYSINGNGSQAAGSYTVDHVNGSVATNWLSSTLTIDTTAGSTSTFVGSYTASNGNLYSISATMTGAIVASNTSIMWSGLSGSFTNMTTGAVQALTLRAMDPCLGLNCTPYNSTTNTMEFGFWTYNNGATGMDLNIDVHCTSATSASTAGQCPISTSSTSSGGGSVPVPGSLSLLGLGLVGAALRRRKQV